MPETSCRQCLTLLLLGLEAGCSLLAVSLARFCTRMRTLGVSSLHLPAHHLHATCSAPCQTTLCSPFETLRMSGLLSLLNPVLAHSLILGGGAVEGDLEVQEFEPRQTDAWQVVEVVASG